jgi:manganese/zinc/iron transport system substrate-binding protein
MYFKKLLVVWLFCLGLLSLPVQAQPLKVLVTTGMIADLVENIGGSSVEVTALMGSGVDPHLYKATQGDVRRLLQADVIFFNGLHLEGKMQDMFDKLQRKQPVFAVSENIPQNHLRHFGPTAHDPHIWFDVSLWLMAGETVLQKLSAQDPEHQADYQANAQAYFAKLKTLDAWVRAQIMQIPAEQRVLITAHDAFGYFGDAYGMEVRGLQGISTATEFGLRDIKILKDVITERKIKAVFVESSVPKKFIESLVAGVQESGHQLVIGGQLYSDAMGLAGTPEGTYIGMVTANVNTLVSALK